MTRVELILVAVVVAGVALLVEWLAVRTLLRRRTAKLEAALAEAEERAAGLLSELRLWQTAAFSRPDDEPSPLGRHYAGEPYRGPRQPRPGLIVTGDEEEAPR